MRLTRFAAIALSATALAAVGAPFAAHAATEQEAAHRTGASAAPSVAVYDCGNHPLVRPRTFLFFCNGSGAFLGLRWSTWNASVAAATGVEATNNCTPNCAQGKVSRRTVNLILWRSLPVKGHPGRRGYTQMTVLYPHARVGSGNTATSYPPGAFPGES